MSYLQLLTDFIFIKLEQVLVRLVRRLVKQSVMLLVQVCRFEER